MSIWKNKTIEQTGSDKKSRATEVDLQGLIKLRYQSTHLSLGSQRKAYSSLSGNYNSPFKGRGLNFDEVRPYQPGDDIRNIDWNVTARTDKVHTKVFKEERERPVFIIVDLSSSMYFGTRHCLKSVAAAKAAALFAWAGADNSNRIGGLVFNDTSHIEMRPKGGHRGVLQFLKMLTDFHNKPIHHQAAQQHKDSSSESESEEALNTELLFARIQKIINPGSIVLLASDFNQSNIAFLKHIRHIARHNDLLMAHVYDTLESQLPPPGQYGINNGIDSQSLDTRDSTLRHSFHELFQQKMDDVEQFCIQNQIHLINLATHDKVADQFLATLGKDASVRRIARSRH
ncbi:MAG: DUF58 domain-containing protein [gamma proteobacterium symbiont of Bathyaustriella thionipta]|nr:DUF58 domain-containing protein [gamma proteobacterium symbiont of Bathyaustriella thionipta]MCU7948875.1 DUF58 domain-containing protein [gamma proteobacterium symbiont of Bathyaustriella thionipta]MCU7952377.1 DUF58 domain-containing protein [gamma proteobacterium symbiont of Bathyaustriella thionipta]MCU7955332.1 DUF58 domain-containing protein [gamma proteobacterium symbiont of Bathyaustriella thionipta]MCU7966120.1 DUF58 domain-containing protein [gamma proteobacterium symbiont of Bathy